MSEYSIGGGPNQPQINIENTQQVVNFDGGILFQEGVILRKVSKFLAGTEEDAIIPCPVFFDPVSKKILSATLPPYLREELKDYLIDA